MRILFFKFKGDSGQKGTYVPFDMLRNADVNVPPYLVQTAPDADTYTLKHWIKDIELYEHDFTQLYDLKFEPWIPIIPDNTYTLVNVTFPWENTRKLRIDQASHGEDEAESGGD